MYYDRLSDLGIKLTRRSGQEKVKCPQCSDGRKNKHDKSLSVNINTGEFLCHNDCGFKGNVRKTERKRENRHYEKPSKEYTQNQERNERVLAWFKSRGISETTLQRFVIFNRAEWMPQTNAKENCICFPYFRDQEIVNIKFRDGRKNFKMVKGAELILYNLNSIKDRKRATVVEGELDCLALYEAGVGHDSQLVVADTETGEVSTLDYFGQFGILSVPNGASKSGNPDLTYLDNCADWIEPLEEVVIATDNDEAGMRLKDELLRRIGVEKCRYVVYPTERVVKGVDGTMRPCKDINEVLLHYGAQKVRDLIQEAVAVPVDGIYAVEDVFPTMIANFRAGIQLAPTTRFPEIDEIFRWKKGDINLVVGYGNHGKSTFILQLMMIKSKYDGWKWAVFSPENYPANDFYDDLVEMYVGKPLQNMTDDEYIDACDFLNQHIFYVYPDDEHDLLSIQEKFRHLILKKGVDGVMIDPFNQLDHIQKAYQRDDQYLSVTLKDIKRFALLNNVCYNVVAHPKNPSKDADKSLPIVDMYDVAGGAMWGNKVDQIISYYRPQYHVDKSDPLVQIHIQKVKRKRTGGKLGMAELYMDWAQRRFKGQMTGNSPLQRELVEQAHNRENNQIANGYGYSQPPLLTAPTVVNVDGPETLPMDGDPF